MITATPRLDRALDKRIASFARLAKRTVAAANLLLWEMEAVGKWEAGTTKHRRAIERRDLADRKYEELSKQLLEIAEELGG